jgi:hypothetical protein
VARNKELEWMWVTVQMKASWPPEHHQALRTRASPNASKVPETMEKGEPAEDGERSRTLETPLSLPGQAYPGAAAEREPTKQAAQQHPPKCKHALPSAKTS